MTAGRSSRASTVDALTLALLAWRLRDCMARNLGAATGGIRRCRDGARPALSIGGKRGSRSGSGTRLSPAGDARMAGRFVASSEVAMSQSDARRSSL